MSLLLLLNPKNYGFIDYGPWIDVFIDSDGRNRRKQEEDEEKDVKQVKEIVEDIKEAQPFVDEETEKLFRKYSEEYLEKAFEFQRVTKLLEALEAQIASLKAEESLMQGLYRAEMALGKARADLARRIMEIEEEEIAAIMLLLH